MSLHAIENALSQQGRETRLPSRPSFDRRLYWPHSRDDMGPAFRFSHVFLDYSAPLHAGVYEEFFGCPLAFDQPSSGYERTMDDARLDLADHRTHAMAREICDQLLVEVHHANSAATSVWRLHASPNP